MKKMLDLLKKSVPYMIILGMTLLTCNTVFYDGLPYGDDFYYHFANMLDKYNSIIENHTLKGISGNLAQGIGSGGGLFYSPLSHITVVILAVILKVFGVTLVSAYKITVVGSVFLSGVFTYRFTMHFTKNNKVAALLAAACYVLYPYRLFDYFCRNAIAEAFSFTFIPLFLMGLYDITHIDDEPSITHFAEVILGGALLYLSHNITATYVFIVGAVYLLMNVHRIIPLMRKRGYLVYSFASVALLMGIASIALFSQLELMGTDIYNLTDKAAMWTDVSAVTSNVKEEWTFSGFYNISFLSYYGVNGSSLYTGVIMYVISCLVFVVAMKLMSDIKMLKYWDLLISAIAQIIVVVLVKPEREIYFAVLIFLAIYVFTYFMRNESDMESKPKIYKNPLFLVSVLTIIISLMAMETEEFWRNMPSILLNIQFPWRMWALVQISIAILVGLFAEYYAKEINVTCLLIICVTLLMATSQHSIEKRVLYEKAHTEHWIDTVDESFFDRGTALGHNKEYCPQVFFDNDYKPSYQNSLYYQVGNIIKSSYYNGEDYTIKPVFLNGSGEITVNSVFAPRYEMTVKAYEDGIIQMPLIYYPGYKIVFENVETGENVKVKGGNLDGLVAFEIPRGNYTVRTKYTGTAVRQTSIALTVLCSLAVTGALVYEGVIKKKK